ncbi:MAG: ExbD/TolR family protein, partial [Leadbetterella sp.]
EIQESGGGGKGKGGKVRSAKKSGKPDMTPMVDLGFLLITFFMFTTTFSKPNKMDLNMPKKDGPVDDGKVKKSNTITILMGKDDRIFWYQEDIDDVKSSNLVETDYSSEGIRKDVMNKKATALNKDMFTVIIKPTKDCNFKNTVDILDEMSITNNKKFAIVDVEKVEQDAYNEKIKQPKFSR